MDTLPRAVALLGLELGASLYIGIRVYGSVAEAAPPMGLYLSAWSSLLFGAGLLASIRGICRFGESRDRTLEREAGAARPRPAEESAA